MGLGPLANALVQMELGESYLGALSMNTQGPDDATMLTLLEHGTPLQKEKFLKPLLNGEKRICYSMTEKAAGADATGMQTRAERHGDSYVLNGEKWFSSAASVADIALVMAKTNPDAPRHRQFSTFLVELPNPGYRIKRDIKTMAIEGPLSHMLGGGHSEVEIDDLRGAGGEPARRRRATASRWASIASRTDGSATACTTSRWRSARSTWRRPHVTRRSTFGKKLDERQAVQFMLAECASQLYIARLMLLHIAYKAENKLDLRQENGIAKVFLANMVHHVVDTAIQLHGALGYSCDTPLAAWYTHIRAQRLVDGPDEVHKWTTGRNVIKTFKETGTTAAACGGDLI